MNTALARAGVRVNNSNPWFRNDQNHGPGWYGNGKPFAGTSNLIDGPVLFGYNGGALGKERFGTERVALHWNFSGSVDLGTNNPQAPLHVKDTVLVDGTIIAG